MPTLRNATTKPGWFIRWKPHPDHRRPSTYQITNRARRLLRDMGYLVPNEGDEIEIPHSLCRPLRILGDLHFENEESPGDVEIDQSPSIPTNSGGELPPKKEVKLRKYIKKHPRLTDEKEEELTEDLNRLNSDIDLQLDSEPQPSDGPAGEVNIDPDDFFSSGNGLSPEVEEILQNNEPGNVGEKIPEAFEEAMGQISYEEYYESISEVSGHKESLQEFDKHSRDFEYIRPVDGALRYGLGWIDHYESGRCFLSVIDGRQDSDKPDIKFELTILGDSEMSLFEHEIHIDDSQFVHWSVTADEENISEGITDSDVVSGEEFHRILHDRSWLLEVIEEFVSGLENIKIQDPVEWKNFD